jgi:hypothetical protein
MASCEAGRRRVVHKQRAPGEKQHHPRRDRLAPVEACPLHDHQPQPDARGPQPPLERSSAGGPARGRKQRAPSSDEAPRSMSFEHVR